MALLGALAFKMIWKLDCWTRADSLITVIFTVALVAVMSILHHVLKLLVRRQSWKSTGRIFHFLLLLYLMLFHFLFILNIMNIIL